MNIADDSKDNHAIADNYEDHPNYCMDHMFVFMVHPKIKNKDAGSFPRKEIEQSLSYSTQRS